MEKDCAYVSDDFIVSVARVEANARTFETDQPAIDAGIANVTQFNDGQGFFYEPVSGRLCAAHGPNHYADTQWYGPEDDSVSPIPLCDVALALFELVAT